MSLKVVALGGGHGLAASLAALRRVTPDVTAIVTVADDGGSSGRLRREFGVLPPGDLRMALAALCGDDDWGTTWSRVVQHRFGGTGDLGGHSVGNLLIAALWDLLGDPVAGLDWVGRLLRVTGRVLPMAAVPMDIVASVAGLDPARPDEVSIVRGQASVAVTTGRVRSISLLPADPPAVPEAVAAVLDADWVVFGPGSWFTSVLPHLLVPSLAAALRSSPARRLLALNLVPQPGETDGFSPHRHVEVFADHAPSLSVDVVLADRAAVSGPGTGADLADLEKAAGSLHASVVLADVAAADGVRHDPVRLAAAYRQVFESSEGSERLEGSEGGGSTHHGG
ncbi:MAG TPA: uridine diphosphate-N-acetylglucosamine-binding protein YvcK [Trebonia sp.]|nr:uridine diphosphate-N-acetylglucosamine-binding protein YvcK [Trebonia sp.]